MSAVSHLNWDGAGPVGPRSSPPVIDWYLHGNNVQSMYWICVGFKVICASESHAPVLHHNGHIHHLFRELQGLVGSPRSSSWLAPWVLVPVQQRVVHRGGTNCVCGTRQSSDCPAPVSASPETIDAVRLRIWSVHHSVNCQNLDLNLNLKHLCCSLSGLNCPNSLAWSQ